ncbi:MAG: ABC transporter substrate-binding protein [Bilophila wadsworthia]
MLESVTRVDTPSPHTVIVRLSRPFPLLPKLPLPALVLFLGTYSITGTLPHPANKKAVGSGPFMLESFTPDRSIRLVRVPRFFCQIDRLRTMTFRIFWDQGEIPLALASGEVDVYLFASCIQLRRFLDGYKFAPFTVLPLGNLHPYTVLSYNLRQKPFSDRKVRRAFALAIDRNFLADRLLHGMVKPLSGPFPPGALFYTPLPAPHDIAEANRLLDEAGYPRGKDGKRFSIIVDYSPDSPLPRELLRLLQYELAARLGIEVRTRDSESVSDWMRHVVTGDYQVVLDELFAWYDPVIGIHRLYSKNNSDRGIVWTNSGGYANDTVEALMQQATEEAIPRRRQTLYDRLQRELVEECPTVVDD